MTQVASAPPKFVFFINHKKHLRKDFQRYLENKMRVAFEFTGVPVRIAFRSKDEEEGGDR